LNARNGWPDYRAVSLDARFGLTIIHNKKAAEDGCAGPLAPEIIGENIRIIFMRTIARARDGGTIAYRPAVGVAVATALLQVWMDLALGTEDDNSAGLLYVGPLVLGIGAIIARLRPQGMVRALFATALAQALVAVIAMIAWKQYFEILILNGFFIALWVGSALLFRRAAREPVRLN
jgi:hypothetical protein